MEGRRLLRSMLAVLAVTAFSACGGGGGGSSVPSTGSGSGSTNQTQTTQAKQQSAANAALSVTGNTADVDQFGSTSSITSFAIQRAIATRNGNRTDGGGSPSPSPSAGACQNGVEYSQSGSNGTYTETIEFFFDSGCTQPRKLVSFTITFNSSGGTLTGTETYYNMSGSVVYYKTDNATFTLGSNQQQLSEIVLERTDAVSPSATPFKESGIACIFSGPGSSACGNGLVATVNNANLSPSMTPPPSPSASPGSSASPAASASPTASPTPFEVGFTGSVTTSVSTPSPSPSASPSSAPTFGWNPQPVTITADISGSGYTGGPLSMTIASPAPGVSPPLWTLSGGTQITTLTGTASLGFQPNGCFSNNVNITLTDSADGYTITFTSQGQWGGLQGTVTNSSGQTVATANIDANGDGVIYFTSGGYGLIRDWVILTT